MDVDRAKKLQHPQATEIEGEWVCSGVSRPNWSVHKLQRAWQTEPDALRAAEPCSPQTIISTFILLAPHPFFSTAKLNIVCLSVWKISMIAGPRTAPPTGKCMTRYKTWIWHRRLAGVLCLMKNWSVEPQFFLFTIFYKKSFFGFGSCLPPRLNVGTILRCVLQKQLRGEAYGPKLSDVERQIAAHNLLHQEIEAYSDQLKPSTTTSQVAAQSCACFYSTLLHAGCIIHPVLLCL